MLRITQAIELKLKKNEGRLSREFLEGLGLALMLHLLLFFIFRIVTLPNLDNAHPLPPIAVEVDLSKDDIVVLPLVKKDFFPLQSPEHPPYFENFHQIPALHIKTEPLTLHIKPSCPANFDELEKMQYRPLVNLLEEEDD